MPSTQGSIDSTSLRSVVDSIKSGWKRRVDVLTDAKSHLQDMVPSQPAGVLAPPAGDYRKLLAGHSDRTEWITGSMSHAEKEGVANRNAEGEFCTRNLCCWLKAQIRSARRQCTRQSSPDRLQSRLATGCISAGPHP